MPRRNSIVNGSNFLVRYSEDNLRNLTLSWNGSKVLDCEAGTNKECSASVNLVAYDGKEIEYYFNISDPLRTVSSTKTKVKVDTSPPVINSVSVTVDGRRARIKINITEENLDRVEYIDHSDSNQRYKILCNRLNQGICEKEKSFSYGNHSITSRVVDEIGYVDTADAEFEI